MDKLLYRKGKAIEHSIQQIKILISFSKEREREYQTIFHWLADSTNRLTR